MLIHTRQSVLHLSLLSWWFLRTKGLMHVLKELLGHFLTVCQILLIKLFFIYLFSLFKHTS